MKNAVTRTPTGETEYSGSTSPTDAPDTGGDVEHVSIDVAENGGYIVTCMRKGSEKDRSPSPAKYAVSSREELDATLDDLLGTPDQSDQQPQGGPDVESANGPQQQGT